jgi:SAM-dependent methyltransferase
MASTPPPSTTITEHYLSDEIDPLLLRGSRDYLSPYLKSGCTLNVGLGYGVWDELLAELPGEAVGLDIDGALVAHFRAKYPRIRYIHSDVFDYRPDHPFDTIVASHLLEHVDRPIELLQLFRSWLSPGGHLLVVVPNAESLHRQIGLRMGLLNQLLDLNETDHRLGHVRVYTFELLREHLEAGQLKIHHLCGVTLKPMSNGQLSAMSTEYLDACVRMSHELGRLAAQIAAVTSV